MPRTALQPGERWGCLVLYEPLYYKLSYCISTADLSQHEVDLLFGIMSARMDALQGYTSISGTSSHWRGPLQPRGGNLATGAHGHTLSPVQLHAAGPR